VCVMRNWRSRALAWKRQSGCWAKVEDDMCGCNLAHHAAYRAPSRTQRKMETDMLVSLLSSAARAHNWTTGGDRARRGVVQVRLTYSSSTSGRKWQSARVIRLREGNR
jgi:hypothetical protein